ncbi:MAG: hypothetical protein GY850_48230 [bacterium]|nr:hypothetical protein [bacterium]
MPPQEFDFSQCLKFLTRPPLEPCHVVENNILFKLEKFEREPVLIKIQCRDQNTICIDFLTPRAKKSIRDRIAKYVWHWFDLETDLRPFYRMAGKDPVLKNVTKELYGLRILTISDLFEAICWAIIGQQINLTFAYTLKKGFVESFGETFYFDNRCLMDPAAFPVDDVGLQNAVKQQLGLSKKPTGEDIGGFSDRRQNRQAYATFYLWQSLIG